MSGPGSPPNEMSASHTLERKKGEQRGLDTDTWAILKLKNSALGMPQSIIVEGSVKCVICSGYSMDRLVCDDCRDAVKLIRGAGNMEVLKELVEFASQPGNLTLFQMLTDEALGEIMLKRIREARDG